MIKQLDNLCKTYKNVSARDFNRPAAISMLCKTRNKAYNSVLPLAEKEDIQEDVVTENLEFCGLLAEVAKNLHLLKGSFENIMTVIANMNKTSFGLLDEDSQMQVLESEIGMVREVFKELKQNPHKAGIKIKSMRFAINSLMEQKDDLLEKWREERDNFENSAALTVDGEPTL